MTLPEIILHCAGNKELVKEFDRLNGSNLLRAGTPLDLAIDDASGRTAADVAKFAEFVRVIVCGTLMKEEGTL